MNVTVMVLACEMFDRERPNPLGMIAIVPTTTIVSDGHQYVIVIKSFLTHPSVFLLFVRDQMNHIY